MRRTPETPVMFWVVFAIAVAVSVVYVAALWREYSRCDGAVVEDALGWPTCVVQRR